MLLEDPLLPAAAELAGAAAGDLLSPAVIAAGGELHRARCVGIHYAPGRELVARYDCDVSWPSGPTRDTLLAATTTDGHLPGTIPVTAETSAATLRAGVWRWPFDPLVVGLPIAATPKTLARHIRTVTGGGPVRVEVVAYRPTERAVVRVTDVRGRTFYLKAVQPEQVEPMVTRHEALRRAGVAAPQILHVDTANGLLLLACMPGSTLRDRIKSGHSVWPRPEAITDLLAAIDAAGQGLALTPARASRTHDAIALAGLVAAIVPEAAETVEALRSELASALGVVEQRSGAVVHGDLHESQLFVDDAGTLTGIIDLDDLGPGDPLDDPAVLLGHLEYRALTGDPVTADLLRSRTVPFEAHVAGLHGAAALDRTIAAVLIGLATGPFRSQVAGWRDLTLEVLAVASRRMESSHLRTQSGS